MGFIRRTLKKSLFAEGFQDSTTVFDTAAGNGLRIGIERKDLHGEVALVAILAQRFQDGCESRISEPRSLPIGIVDVDMAQMA